MELLRRPAIVPVLVFILVFKLPDAAMGFMVKPFWVDVGFSAAQIGLVSVNIGLALSIAGGVVGGWITDRIGIFKSLWILGLAQAVSNLGYWIAAGIIPLAAPGASIPIEHMAILYAASATESFTGGLGTAAFLAFLMAIVEKERAATEYALLSSVFALSRSVAGWLGGLGAQSMGYGNWFLLTFFLAAPAYLLLAMGSADARSRQAAARAPAATTRHLLARRDAAVDVEDLPGDESAGRRAEEERRPDDIVGLSDAAQRNPVDDLRARDGIVEPVVGHRRAHDGRRDAVDGDPVPRELHRVLLHQHDEPALGAAVGGIAAIAQAELRPHRQQMHVPAAMARGDLMARDRLAQEHRGLEIDLVDFVVRLLGHVEQRLLALDADAIHQDVEVAAPRDGGVDRRADRRDRMRIHRDSRGRASRVRASLPARASALPPSRPATTTSAPCRASPQAIAAPMPP